MVHFIINHMLTIKNQHFTENLHLGMELQGSLI